MNPLPSPISSSLLSKYVTSGDIVIEQDELFLIGSSKRLYTYIKLENYNALLKEADVKEVSIGEILDEILGKHYRQKRNLK